MSNDTGLMVIPEPVRMQLAKRGMDESQWNTLANVLYPGAAPASALMVWDYCMARKLDPFKKPVHIVPMRVRVGAEWITRDTVLPGIYEYRTTAQRTGEYMGKSKPEYGPTISIFGVDAPEWCELTVYRWNEKAKEKVPFTVRVLFKEACATKWTSKTDQTPIANDRWNRAPVQMLTKCTEAAALREAFPEEIGGVPTVEEIEDHMPDVIEGSVIVAGAQATAAAEEKLVPPPVYEKVSEALRENLEKAFKALSLSKAQALVEINKFIKAENADEGAEQLLEWCKDEYARRQGRERVKPAANANDKGAAPTTTEAPTPKEAEIVESDESDSAEDATTAASAPIPEPIKAKDPEPVAAKKATKSKQALGDIF